MSIEFLSKNKLAEIRSLNIRKNREKLLLTKVEGFKAVQETMNTPEFVRYIVINEEAENRLQDLIKVAAAKKIPCFMLNCTNFKSCCSTKTPQNILAVTGLPEFLSLNEIKSETDKKILILDKIQDPGNVGTLIRTAAAFEIKTVISTKGSVELSNPKVVRSTAGLFWKLKFCVNFELNEIFEQLAKEKYEILLADLSGKPYYNHQFRTPWALILSNEGAGFSDYLDNSASDKLRLISVPLSEEVESLNVAVAGAIILARSYSKN